VTLGEWLPIAAARLERAGAPAARLEAQIIAAHVLLRERSWVLAHPEESLPALAAEALLQRREAGEPLAYLLGRREFYGREFQVSPSVLIPRHETETLVELALDLLPPGPHRVLDLGAGSGCIGITLHLERPELDVTLSDLSETALAVAELNAEALGAKVRLRRSDLFADIQERFDLIASNPPYVAKEDPLPREVADFEPALALFAPEEGLSFYRRLASESPDRLTGPKLVAVEVGQGQAPSVASIFESEGWAHLMTRRDLNLTERALAFRWTG
jgi:release factor glutamine methyltransferase